MSPERYYVVEKVPFDRADPQAIHDGATQWYCHMKGFPNIPVGGSIGTRQHAAAVCRYMNIDGKARFA